MQKKLKYQTGKKKKRYHRQYDVFASLSSRSIPQGKDFAIYFGVEIEQNLSLISTISHHNQTETKFKARNRENRKDRYRLWADDNYTRARTKFQSILEYEHR